MDNCAWKTDNILEDTLKRLVSEKYSRKEILLYMQRDFTHYSWSIRSLDRRLRHFDIFYSKLSSCRRSDVRCAVALELNGTGRFLGYRAMQKKLNMIHNIPATREVVYDVMKELDPDMLADRRPCFKRKIRPGHYSSPGPNFTHSVDGHDKLMGFQNWTFPIAIYGSLDSCSRRVMWIKVWPSNSDPKIIGKFYLEHLVESRVIPRFLRMDRGTETGVMATMQAYLRSSNSSESTASDSVIYGPSTSNQIERWWRELHQRMEKFFKPQLLEILNNNYYDPSNQLHRYLLSYVMVAVIQREVDIFVKLWNTHRIRPQKDAMLPSGIPNHIFDFPEEYGLKQCGQNVTKDQLVEVAELSGFLDIPDDFLPGDLRRQCQEHIPDPSLINVDECGLSFRYLKQNIC